MEPENKLDAGSAREGPASPAVAAPSRLESMARTCLGHSGSAADSGLAPGAPAPPPISGQLRNPCGHRAVLSLARDSTT